LYIETSTHGRGGHGFALLDKQDCGPELVNDLLLRRLAPWLNKIAEAAGFDIEFVEIKGSLPVVLWGDHKHEVRSYTAGCLAKLPRDGEARFDELQNTAVVTIYDLLRLPVAEKKSTDVSVRKPATALKKQGEATGSISGRHITEDALAGLQAGGCYRVVAEALLGHETLPTSGRQVDTVEDVAVALLLGEWFTKNMLPNGALPHARWKGLWSSLYKRGEVKRAWCHKRFKAIRDLLSSLGLIDWEDERYAIGWHDEIGDYHKGDAAKWRLSEELMQVLAEARNMDGQANFDSANCGQVQDRSVPDNKEEGEHPLWEHDFREWVHCLVVRPDDETICPVERARWAVYRFNATEIDDLLAPLVALAA
jgi:hypothetical protein